MTALVPVWAIAVKDMKIGRTEVMSMVQAVTLPLNYLVMMVLFVLAARMPHLSWPALLLAYAATLVVFWWVPFAWARGRAGS